MIRVMTAQLSMFATIALAGCPSDAIPHTGEMWKKRFAEKAAIVRSGGSSVVFLGDENIHFFETKWGGESTWNRYWAGAPYRALNLGFSGDVIGNVLWRVSEGGELDGYSAKAVVLNVGINNLITRGEPVGDVICGTRRLLEEISVRQPTARTILCALLPRGGAPDCSYQDRLDAVNREICKFADGRAVIWCYFSDVFVNVRTPAEGYEIWTAALMPMVNCILHGDGMPVAPRFPVRLRIRDAMMPQPESLRPVSRIMEPSRTRGMDWWGRRFAANRNYVAAHKSIDLVMVGDSITHYWETNGARAYAVLTNGLSVLNCGYGGDQSQNVLWRLMHGEIDGYRAKTVMLMIGTNNNGIRGCNPTNTADGVKACLGLITRKQPQAKVLLCAIPPRAVGTADGNPSNDVADARNRITNELIRMLADGKNVTWVDFRDKFLVGGNIPKSLMADYIHPTEKGYEIWLEAIRGLLPSDFDNGKAKEKQ